MKAYFSVDVEQDCPPYLNTWRGLDQGMGRLLSLLDEECVRGTFFTTGETARRYPRITQAIVDAGHELACHGDSHRSFATMTEGEADTEIADASATLRAFGPVVSFRAPYLQFPATFLPVLRRHHYALDSSEGRHKMLRASVRTEEQILRVPASVTSSTLRWPALVRDRVFARLNDPPVLFVHPWEFVDLRRERLRLDCRFKTGRQALDCTRSTLRFFLERGATFALMRDLVGRHAHGGE